jgi:hypothetical protein
MTDPNTAQRMHATSPILLIIFLICRQTLAAAAMNFKRMMNIYKKMLVSFLWAGCASSKIGSYLKNILY